uniref:Putative product n=1 Tax=Xenopsylla cheopis TaxID=163159 RepID=A0A6M2DZP6_XENCH
MVCIVSCIGGSLSLTVLILLFITSFIVSCTCCYCSILSVFSSCRVLPVVCSVTNKILSDKNGSYWESTEFERFSAYFYCYYDTRTYICCPCCYLDWSISWGVCMVK